LYSAIKSEDTEALVKGTMIILGSLESA